ncbi:MAG: FAD:protein FMN transferase, partial [Fidelibacterota bacterium]
MITGHTMGTTYSVKIRNVVKKNNEIKTTQILIDSTLNDLNQQVSTYLPDSDITIFNESRSMDWFNIPAHFQKVIEKSLEVYTLSKGAFDVTVHPIVRLWGFGKDGRKWAPPEESQIHIALES